MIKKIQYPLMNRKFKRTAYLFEIEIFYCHFW